MDAKLLSSATPLLLLLHLLLLLCMQAWPVVEGLQLEVTGRTTKCIAEEIQSDVLVVGDYKVVSTSEDDLSVTAKVRILSVSLALLVFRPFFGSLSLYLCCYFFFPLINESDRCCDRCCDRCSHCQLSFCNYLFIYWF
jgi:hypothetical protein